MTPPERAEARGTCTWTADGGPWQSACGVVYAFEDGAGPVENGHRYCHGCGGRLVVLPCLTCEGYADDCPDCGRVTP